MDPVTAILYSFFFGLLHGVLPDEHTWPITFSYAIGSGSGKEGMKAGFYFSLAFTVQRAFVSQLAYFALTPFIFIIDRYIFLLVGIVMFLAGVFVLKKNINPHLHLLKHRHREGGRLEIKSALSGKQEEECIPEKSTPPVKWTLIHGFVAGFGFEGFAVFINTIAAPAMPGAWLGFLPGLVFGIGTMLMLLIIGALFGVSLKWVHSLTQDDIRRIGAETGGRTLFYGGILFTIVGILTLANIEIELPFISDYTMITIFMIVIAIPAFVYSYREIVKAKRNRK